MNFFNLIDGLRSDATLLDVACSTANCVNLTWWANGKYGAIVNHLDDDVLRFVDYYNNPDAKEEENRIRKIHLSEEEELACPIVAAGIVVYWIMYRNSSLGTKEIFENYYAKCLNRYIEKEKKSLDACDRNIPKEFAQRKHLQAELKRMEQSEAIYPYLKQEDIDQIKEMTNYYVKYVRDKSKKIYPPSYSPGFEHEEPFLKTYEGPARLCLDWICKEYDLPPMGPLWGCSSKVIKQEEFNHRHKIEEPRIIRWEVEDYDEIRKDLFYRDSALMEEININLANCKDQEDRIRYVIKVLSYFKYFAMPFYPNSQISEHESSIEDHKKALSYWEKVDKDAVDEESEEPLHPEEQINACKKTITKMEADIKYWHEKSDKLYRICQDAIQNSKDENPSIELCLFIYWSDMIRFYRRLTALLLTYKIKLMDVQKKCGIFLSWCVEPFDYVDDKYVPNYEYARSLLNEIEKKQSSKKATRKKETPKAEVIKTSFCYNPKELDISTINIRLQQVYENMKKEEVELLPCTTNMKDFLEIFSGKETTTKIAWSGQKNVLHYILSEWVCRGYLPKPKGGIWGVAAARFYHRKKDTNGALVDKEFTPDELRKAGNPQNPSDDLEQIIEMLKPDVRVRRFER